MSNIIFGASSPTELNLVYNKDQIFVDISSGIQYIQTRNPNGASWIKQVTGVFLSPSNTGSTWGNIGGTLSNQTDLQSALNIKVNISDLSVDVRAVTLTGLSIVNNPVTATDTLLVAIGELQGQINAFVAGDVPSTRTLTINGTTFDLSANRAWSVGTVTTVSIATANGISGTSSGGATPSLTLTLGSITPTSVNGVTISGSATPSLAVTGTSSISGSNTGDQTITLTGNVTGSGTGSFATTIASGVVTNTMLAGSIDLTTKVTGILPLTNGGSNANLTASNGGIVWSNASQMQILSGTSTAGLALVSGATATPSWFTPTAGQGIYTGTGGILVSDNTFLYNGAMLSLQASVALGGSANASHLISTASVTLNSGLTGAYSFINNNQTISTTGSITGIYAGYLASPTISGSNNLATYYSFYAEPTYSGTGNIGIFRGYSSKAILSNSGTVSSLYNFYASSPVLTSTGTIGTAYGLYINTQSVTGVTTGYGVYQNGSTDINYFAGRIGIHDVSPNFDLGFGSNSSYIGVEASVTDSFGKALTITAGSTVTGTSVNDIAGGTLVLGAGAGTGAGHSQVFIQTGTNLASGKVLQTVSSKLGVYSTGGVAIGTYATSTAAPANSLTVPGWIGVGVSQNIGAFINDSITVNGTNYALITMYTSAAKNSGIVFNQGSGNGHANNNTLIMGIDGNATDAYYGLGGGTNAFLIRTYYSSAFYTILTIPIGTQNIGINGSPVARFQVNGTGTYAPSTWGIKGAGFQVTPSVYTDAVTAAGATVASISAVSFNVPTFTASLATGGSKVSYTDVTNAYFDAPIMGLNTLGTKLWSIWSIGNVRIDGLIGKYNGDVTTGNGVASIVGSYSQVNANATIATTTLFTANNTGLYRYDVYIVDTTASVSGGTVTVSVNWVDSTGTPQSNASLATIALSTIGLESSGSQVIELQTAQIASFTATVSGVIVGTPTYTIRITLTKLQ